MIYRYLLLYTFSLLVVVALAYPSYAADTSTLGTLNTKQTKTTQPDISGFLINIRGIVGYTIPSISNMIFSNSNIVPDKFSSPVEGGGAVSLGFRFALTSLDVTAPAYMRFELEYAQRAPYSLYGKTQAYSVENRGTLNPDYGYQADSVTYALQEHSFKLRTGTQDINLGIFIDIGTQSLVVPYIGAMLGITIYDIQLSVPSLEVFSPTQSVGGTIYGTIEEFTVKSTEASFTWGLAAGIIMVVNDYISFDIGLRYTNNIPITTGRDGSMKLKLKYDFIETMFGMSVTL